MSARSRHRAARTAEAVPAPSRAHLQVATRRLVEQFAPLRIIVFGSYARGEVRPGSDLDLLVVLPSVENEREAAIAMRHVLADLPVPKDIVVTTPEEINRRRGSTWHLVGMALREGHVVYEKAEAA